MHRTKKAISLSTKGKVIEMKLCKAVLLSVMIFFVCVPSYSFAEDVIRIGILRFESKANGISYSNAESITDELTRMLAGSYSIAIIDRSSLEAIAREHRMSLAGLIDPRTATKLGHVAGIQYLITGAITNFSHTENVKHNDSTELWKLLGKDWAKYLGAKTITKTENAEITLDLRIIDVNTQEVVLSMAETGKATRTNTFSAGNIRNDSANVQNISLRDVAVSDAVARIGPRIKEAVAGEYTQVLRVSGGDIFISIGSTSGAKIGNLYKVSFEGEEILDMRGNVLGRTTTPIAVIRIDDVKNDYSIAHVIKKGGNPSNIQRGDRVDQSSSGEASSLIKRKVFLDRRPIKTLGQSGLEGAKLDNRLNNIISEQTNGAKQHTDTYPTAHSESDAIIGASSVQTKPEIISSVYGRNKNIRFEKASTNTAQVIASYGLSESETQSLVERHKQAERMLSNDEKFHRYTKMFNASPSDFFAAYQAAKIAFDVGHNSDAKEWAEKALSVNPSYNPAKKILRAAKNKME